MSKLPGFIGNENEYTQLVSWIKQPNSVFGNVLTKECITIVSGSPGCGKSYGVQMAIKDANKNICYINKDECINSKDFKELILKQTLSNILDQFNLLSVAGESLKETIIFIDDVDTLLAIDRSFINNFNLLITCNTIRTIKIILSCISSELKIILKSIIFGQLILLKTPTDNDVKKLLSNINTNNTENTRNIANIANIIDDSVKLSSGNISVAFNIYNLNIRNIQKDIFNIEDGDKKCVESTDIFPEVAKIYFIEDRNLIRKVIEQDPWLHPLRFHENIIHEFKQRKGTKEQKDKLYIEILQHLCRWDQIMTLSKGGDISNAIEQACNTVLLLTRLKRKKNADPPMDEFTRMFNYLSLRKKNMVSLYEGNFPWESIGSSRKKMYEGYIRKEINSNKVRKVRTRNNTKKLSI
jgi:hypothetical protein